MLVCLNARLAEPLQKANHYHSPVSYVKHHGSMFVANGQCMHRRDQKQDLSCPLRIISPVINPLRTKSRVYQAVEQSILLYSCETWSLRVADERMSEVFDNENIRRFLQVRRSDCVPSVELRRGLCFTRILAQLMQGRFRWFGHSAKRSDCELTYFCPSRLERGADGLEAS